MQRIEYTTNWNGKLLLDNFGTVRLHNPGKYFIGNQMEVVLKGMPVGIVKVIAVRTFKYKQISDVLGYLDVGKPAHYLAQLMRNFYSKDIALTPETRFDHIVQQYTERYVEAQQSILKDWWETKIAQQPFAHKSQAQLSL
jgi:ABC-type antimicrobial peptide transport system permease subunit